jgi:hypothetical protein
MEQKKTGLGRDRQADFFSKLQTAAAFEALFGQEDLNVAQEFSLILERKPTEDRKVTGENGRPRRWNRLTTQNATTTTLEKPEHHAGI